MLHQGSTALCTDREGQGGSGLPCRYISAHISIPEVPYVSRMALVALVARGGDKGVYLFSTNRIVHLGSSLTVPWIPLCISIGTLWIPLDNPYVSLCITTGTHRYS